MQPQRLLAQHATNPSGKHGDVQDCSQLDPFGRGAGGGSSAGGVGELSSGPSELSAASAVALFSELSAPLSS